MIDAVRRGREAIRSIPGVRQAESALGEVERFVFRELKRRLDEIDPDRRDFAPSPMPPNGEQTADALPQSAGRALNPLSLAERMQRLLRRSMRATPTESRQALHEWLIGQLVPDEARILSALSDGGAYPMVHVAEPGVGSFQRRILENASSVGRAAGVALPDRVPEYVSHLRRIGLVETGPEDESIRDEYEVLLTDQVVRAAIKAAGRGPRGARIVRRTIRISALGRELWEATRDDPLTDPQSATSPGPD